MKEIGVVLSDVEPLEVKALLFNENNMPLWNRLVCIPYDGADKSKKFLVGVITYYRGLNDFYNLPDMAKTFASMGNQVEVLQYFKQYKEHLIANIRLLTAFEVSKGRLKRLPIDKPVEVGVPVYKLTDSDLKLGQEYSYLGRFYGEDILQPLYIRDFQTLGEAYHFIVAGQTGSGKSTLVLKLLSLYAKESAKRNPMKFLILTPVPEFVKAFKDGKTSFGLNVRKVFEGYGFRVETYSVMDLAFDTYEVLEELLQEADFWNKLLGIRHHENRSTAVQLVVDFLKSKQNLANLPNYLQDLIEYMRSDEFAFRVYKMPEAQENLKRRMQDEQILSSLSEALLKVLDRFSTANKKRIRSLIWDFVYDQGGRVLVLNMNTNGHKALQFMLLREVINTLRIAGNERYMENPDLNLNTLVVLEEAHNFVPAKVKDDDEKLKQLKEKIITAYAETRKFGIGWLSITTRLSLIDRHVFEHSRVKIIGYGLATGLDRELLRESFGSELVERYSALIDPSDPMSDHRHHVFLVSGPITILSRREPEFVEVFSTPEEFLEKNKMMLGEFFFF